MASFKPTPLPSERKQTIDSNWGEPERAPHWLENRVYERHVYGGYERKNAMTIVCTSVT